MSSINKVTEIVLKNRLLTRAEIVAATGDFIGDDIRHLPGDELLKRAAIAMSVVTACNSEIEDRELITGLLAKYWTRSEPKESRPN